VGGIKNGPYGPLMKEGHHIVVELCLKLRGKGGSLEAIEKGLTKLLT